ncbi:MAG: histidine--tRNA ligase [Nannocystaceae bacterium]
MKDTGQTASASRPRISTKPPGGMRDFLPADLARRAHVIDTIRTVYRRYGFVELETPSIENLSTLVGKYGEEGDQLLYRLLRRRDSLTRALDEAASQQRSPTRDELATEGLRYDLTVPLARVIAQHGELPRYFKRFQIQPVWRADRPGRGRFREFYQCDVDITGTTSLVADAEVITAVTMVLHELGFKDFSLLLNHRQLLREMIRAAGINDAAEGSALIAVDKFDKIGREGVEQELGKRGISADPARRLLDLICDQPDASNEARLDYLAQQIDSAQGRKAITELGELCQLCAQTAASSALKVEARLARGLGYYTGPIFEIVVPDLAGSLGGGGRYDQLVGMFGKREVAAVGFSLGLERILTVMTERTMFPDLQVGPDLVLCWMGIPGTDMLRVANELRGEGVRVETFPEPAKLKKQLQYAANPAVSARYAGILGTQELADGEITLKHLASGKQTRLSLTEAAQVIREQRALS